MKGEIVMNNKKELFSQEEKESFKREEKERFIHNLKLLLYTSIAGSVGGVLGSLVYYFLFII